MYCAGSRYIIDISKWFNKCSLQGISFYGKITTQCEKERMKCNKCESFYCNTSFRCDCGCVFERYCDKCCENNSIEVLACNMCDDGISK